jgi:quercetin dioxygenase-like cupin family protein
VHIPDMPFETTDWSEVPAMDHPGVTGVARWRTRQLGEIRVRMVEYSAGYLADHWCEKGHVLLCLEGTLRTELADGRSVILSPGMTYHVGDGSAPHRSSAPDGARLFIVD